MMSRLHRCFHLMLSGIAVAAFLVSTSHGGQANDGVASTNQAKTSSMPNIRLTVPPRCPAAGPIGVHVTMLADMATYYATNGNIDRAMEVFLVRRDAPGIRQLAKMDPHVIMQPEKPLPPPPGRKPTGFIKEERDLDVLAYGARHEGGADYYVVGVLAGRTSDPQPLTIEDDSRRLPPAPVKDAQIIGSERCKSITPPSSRGMVVRPRTGSVCGIEGAFRLSPEASGRDQAEERRPPFVTIIAARIDPHGGVSSGSFRVSAKECSRDWTGRFFIPVSELVPRPVEGRYRILVFAGDEVARAVEMDIPALR